MPYIVERTITETFLKRVKRSSSAMGFRVKVDGNWKKIPFGDFYLECKAISFGLMAANVKFQDKVVLFSETRYEWPLCDMAILGARAVTVPIYASSTPDEVAYIIDHCEAEILIVENERLASRLASAFHASPQLFSRLKKIVFIDFQSTIAAAGLPCEILSLKDLKKSGHELALKEPTHFADNLHAAQPDDLITICYTSGTTGIPKGAMLTHDNMMSVLSDAVDALGAYINPERELLLSFLPFSHILGRVESMSVYVFGWQQAFCEHVDRLMVNLTEVRPTILFAVPRTFEKAHALISQFIEKESPHKQRLFEWGLKVGSEEADARRNNDLTYPLIGIQALWTRKILFRNIAKRFGGRLKHAICGGAPLSKETGEFFDAVGVQILEGYGLTETCAPVTLNTPHNMRFGTVGRPLPEVTIKIAEDGEILVKSRKVFKGYYKMPEETQDALQDGWLHTGDIGNMDEDGFLRITDRKKDIIITSGGKNIAPQKLENMAKGNPFLNQIVVHGDKRPFLTALVALDAPTVIQYATENHILFSGYTELIRHPKILALVQKGIDDINKHLASYETIKKFAIVPRPFTVEGGELTPSLKARRSHIAAIYRDLLDTMYNDAPRSLNAL